MKAPTKPHRNVQKNTASSTTKGGDSERSRDMGFDIVADYELDGLQANEDRQDGLPR
jgi:hypothetical protein